MNTLARKLIPDQLIEAYRRLRVKSKMRKLLRDPAVAQASVGAIDAEWQGRIDEVISCPDNAAIPRVPGAGQLEGSVLTMHNGVRVYALSYYGAGGVNMLIQNKGVHEPQEERAFMEVLRHLPQDATMLELGAYWGFYSLWFCSALRDARCHLIEPIPGNMEAGKLNFELNEKRAEFEAAFASARDSTPLFGTPTVSVDGYCARKGIDYLHVLHADIQGAELGMLEGARGMLASRRVGFVFISTHSNELHYGCVKGLQEHGYEILASADLHATYSRDGIIVARNPQLSQPASLEIAAKV